MRTLSRLNTLHAGLAILAGSLSFMGTAGGAVLLSENFEGAVNVFGTGTYTYASGYTQPNVLIPGGGLQYMKGGAGLTGLVSTNTFSAGSLSLLTGGITAAQIDGGLISYNLYAQFSSYLTQGDYATVTLRFLDAFSTPLGSTIQVGGQAFTAALPTGPFGNYADARAWGADSLAGLVPAGARFGVIQIIDVKVATGTAIDGYVDNINVSLVPEPTSVALFGLAGGLLTLARRRR